MQFSANHCAKDMGVAVILNEGDIRVDRSERLAGTIALVQYVREIVVSDGFVGLISIAL